MIAFLLSYGLLFCFFLFVYTFVIGRVTGTDIGNFSDLKGQNENQYFGLAIILAIITVLAMKFLLP